MPNTIQVPTKWIETLIKLNNKVAAPKGEPYNHEDVIRLKGFIESAEVLLENRHE